MTSFTDHRIVTYDLRGCGQSTRQGPYDVDTDAADLAALIETVGPPALVIGMGDGCNRAAKVAAEQPQLVSAIVTPGGNPVGREASQGSDKLVDSPSVIEALLGMIETDYRAALRTIIGGANAQLSDDEARERVDRVVEYCPQDVGAARLRAWIDDDVREAAMAVGRPALAPVELGGGKPLVHRSGARPDPRAPPAGTHRGDRGRCGLAAGADRGHRAARNRVARGREAGRRNLGRLDQYCEALEVGVRVPGADGGAQPRGSPGRRAR